MWVLRDFHVDNLFWLPERAGVARVGLIDTQDCVLGHPAYDLASLLLDVRVTFPKQVSDDYLDMYCAVREAGGETFDDARFRQAYAVLGAQRATKILGIFARLAKRDGKPGYLQVPAAHQPGAGLLPARTLPCPGEGMVRAAPAGPSARQGTVMTGRTAMMLAAGLGTRMRPLTLTRPKPLIEVAGRSLLDRGMDALERAGVEHVVVNKHYLPDQIEAWARHRQRPHITVQDESELILDTGGGVAQALPQLGDEPFFVLNSDSFWIDGPVPALERMRAAWDDAKMDCLLLLASKQRSVGFDGPGDFDMDAQGRLVRRQGAYGGTCLCWGLPGASARVRGCTRRCVFDERAVE